MLSAPRESPFDCVARCASSRSFRRYARRLPPMTMLASPEERRAVKDSRGKCRSRWRDITREIMNPPHGHFPASQVSGHGRPTVRTRTFAARSRSRTWTAHGRLRTRMRSRTGRGHGAVADWTRTRRGCGLDTAPDRTRTARGYGHRRGHLAGQIADSPRLFRGRKNLVLTRSKACPVQNR